MSSTDPSEAIEHAAIVVLDLGGEDFGTEADRERFFALEDELIRAIAQADVGEYDGNEIGGGHAVLYAYGTNADRLFDVIAPVIERFGPSPGSHAVKRYGAADDPTAEEVMVQFA